MLNLIVALTNAVTFLNLIGEAKVQHLKELSLSIALIEIGSKALVYKDVAKGRNM